MVEAYFILADGSPVVAWIPEGKEVVRMGPSATPFLYDFSVTENGRTMRVYRETHD